MMSCLCQMAAVQSGNIFEISTKCEFALDGVALLKELGSEFPQFVLWNLAEAWHLNRTVVPVTTEYPGKLFALHAALNVQFCFNGSVEFARCI